MKPEFFTDSKLSELPALCRLLFVGLWCEADREGRLSDTPKELKVKILPYDSCNVDKFLDLLHTEGMIIRYEHENRKYIQIINFLKHQRPNNKENQSLIPSLYLDKACLNLKLVEGKGKGRERERKGKEGGGEERDLTSSNLSASGEAAEFYRTKKGRKLKGEKLEWFDRFWDAFNNKKDKHNATDSWLDIVDLTAELAEKIIASAKREGEVERRPNETRKMAQGWLSDKRWEDGFEPPPPIKTRAEKATEAGNQWVIDRDREDREREADVNVLEIEGEVLDG